MAEGAQYGLRIDANGLAILSGVMRLASQDAYEHEFAAVRERLVRDSSLDIDLTGVQFMNSSGIRWLCVLVLEAKELGAPASIRGTSAVAWQVKSLPGLRAIYDRLTILA
jgi:hypothetical protein